MFVCLFDCFSVNYLLLVFCLPLVRLDLPTLVDYCYLWSIAHRMCTTCKAWVAWRRKTAFRLDKGILESVTAKANTNKHKAGRKEYFCLCSFTVCLAVFLFILDSTFLRLRRTSPWCNLQLHNLQLNTFYMKSNPLVPALNQTVYSITESLQTLCKYGGC